MLSYLKYVTCENGPVYMCYNYKKKRKQKKPLRLNNIVFLWSFPSIFWKTTICSSIPKAKIAIICNKYFHRYLVHLTGLKTFRYFNYCSMYLPSFLGKSNLKTDNSKLVAYKEKLNELFSNSNTGIYNDLVSLPILSTKLYSPVNFLSSIHLLVSSLSCMI